MRALVEQWKAKGWVTEWEGRFGQAGAGDRCPDFFGLVPLAMAHLVQFWTYLCTVSLMLGQ